MRLSPKGWPSSTNFVPSRPTSSPARGKGYMKSDGVAEIVHLKEETARAKGVAR